MPGYGFSLTLIFPYKDPANTKTLLQRRTIGCIDVVSSLKMKASPILVDNIVVNLRSDVVAML